MTQLLSNDWAPPDFYPVVVTSIEDGVWVQLPDFHASLILRNGEDPIEAATRAVHNHLKHRAVNNQLAPFASQAERLGPNVFMVSTAGWRRMDEENPDD